MVLGVCYQLLYQDIIVKANEVQPNQDAGLEDEPEPTEPSFFSELIPSLIQKGQGFLGQSKEFLGRSKAKI